MAVPPPRGNRLLVHTWADWSDWALDNPAPWVYPWPMNIRPLILALAVLSLAPVLPSCSFSQVAQRQEKGLVRLNRSLASVQDRRTADAAAPVVREYGALLRADINELNPNGMASLIQLARLRKTYMNSNISLEAKGSLREFFRIYGQRYYGSTTLRQAFIDILKPAP